MQEDRTFYCHSPSVLLARQFSERGFKHLSKIDHSLTLEHKSTRQYCLDSFKLTFTTSRYCHVVQIHPWSEDVILLHMTRNKGKELFPWPCWVTFLGNLTF